MAYQRTIEQLDFERFGGELTECLRLVLSYRM